MNLRPRIPSLAAAIGAGACVVLVAGSAVAVPSVHAKINGSSIKKHSIPGNRLKPNGVTGKQIKESTLGTVPNAAKLGGVPASGYLGGKRVFKFNAVMNKGDADKPLGTFGPLKFTGHCVADSTNTEADILVKATSPVYFQSGETPLALLTSSSPAELAASEDQSSATYRAEYPLAYTANGSFVLAAEGGIDAIVLTGGSDCTFIGELFDTGAS